MKNAFENTLEVLKNNINKVSNVVVEEYLLLFSGLFLEVADLLYDDIVPQNIPEIDKNLSEDLYKVMGIDLSSLLRSCAEGKISLWVLANTVSEVVDQLKAFYDVFANEALWRFENNFEEEENSEICKSVSYINGFNEALANKDYKEIYEKA